MKLLSRVLDFVDSKHAGPADPEQAFSNLMKRRLVHWKNHASVKNKAVREEIERLRFYNEKVNAYAFAKSQGILCPTNTEYPSVGEALEANRNNPRFVLKPAVGHSSKGVYLLTRNGDGSLQCHMTQQQFKRDDEVAKIYRSKREINPKSISKEVIVEEFLEDAQGHPVPLDYKVYAYHTGVAMIMQKHGPLYLTENNWVFNFYDAKGNLLQNVREEQGDRNNRIEAPASFKGLVDTANKLVTAMKVSFIRIDLFLTPKGIYFGECTPLPNLGKKAFFDEYEDKLGRHWMRSLKALGLDYFQN